MKIKYEEFSDKIVLTFYQESHPLTSIVLLPLANAGPGLTLDHGLELNADAGTLQMPLASLQPTTLLGSSPDGIEQLWAVHIGTAIVKVRPEEARSLVLNFAIKLTHDKEAISAAVQAVKGHFDAS